jgi:membrane associated rhomboid family serine protease
VSTAPKTSVNYCYRHPDRQSFVLCQRCGRTICPQCQTQAAVGVHCPECVKEARGSQPRATSGLARVLRPGNTTPIVTWSIIALCVIVWLLQILPGSPVTQALIYYPPFTYTQPWRMITSVFAHSPSSILHILFNMFSLFVVGPLVETMLGRARYLALFLITGFAGSVAVLLLAPGTPVLGASGAIFGLLGAFFVISRKLGGNSTQLLIIIVLNLAIGFLPGTNVAWQAHLGGVIVGAALGLIYLATRRRNQRMLQVLSVIGVFVALVAITLVRLFAL